MKTPPSKTPRFEIRDLTVNLPSGTAAVEHFSLAMFPGEVHVLLGPNGSGKSTLAQAILGHPSYPISSGQLLLDGEPIQNLPTHERARRGIFLSFQHPIAVPGVSVATVLRRSSKAWGRPEVSSADFRAQLKQTLERVGLEEAFMKRGLHDGFSGGERKKTELAQALLLQPRVMILDEIDSGLDVDAVRRIAREIQSMVTSFQPSILLITHNTRILHELVPKGVHVLHGGHLVTSGGLELAHQIEEHGYAVAS
ncbi:MAG: Fe-S cluster assembly ATPase SufC [Candidatus Kerfeldbacteria bacterium]|nr:Fe-S cluster assembly ATPase SufC [Candidatus Kerfeldbacteria bacterium]